MKRALVAVTLALFLPAAADAHVTVSPPFVQDGVEAGIAFATPNERPPHATVTVQVTVPPGISIISVGAPRGWHGKVSGQSVTWSGGRLEGRSATSFPLRVLARVRAGTHTFTSVQKYDDGAKVEWKADLSVLPASGSAAPKQHLWNAVIAAVVGLIVIAGSLVGVRLLRRRPLQEK